MQQIVYAMQFKGQAVPGGGPSGPMEVESTAVSSSITSVINSGGLTGGFDPAAAAAAIFRSEVTLKSESTFTEAGSITFGSGDHRLRFSTVGEGWLAPGPQPSIKQGTVTWKVEGGEGQFEGAAGLITSNFTLSDTGEVHDYHLGILYIR
ncbi:MAG TPA: hypothetical protein VMZ52_20645 [Bryobacteraceae bacterium]|nr:hypothetical protein [Bryobacteraceae bacterium]